MPSVGVRELKAHLSAYVRTVRRGEQVVITDRGVVVARIVPAESESALQRLIDAGLALPPAHASRPSPTPQIVEGSVSDLVSEQRQ